MGINDERPKLKVKLNGVMIKGLSGSGAGVSILSQETWDLNCPLQEVSTQLWVLEPDLK